MPRSCVSVADGCLSLRLRPECAVCLFALHQPAGSGRCGVQVVFNRAHGALKTSELARCGLKLSVAYNAKLFTAFQQFNHKVSNGVAFDNGVVYVASYGHVQKMPQVLTN